MGDAITSQGEGQAIAQYSTWHRDNSPRERSGPKVNIAKAEKLAWAEED